MAPVIRAQVPDTVKHCYLGALVPELVDNIFSEIDSVRALGNFIITCRFVHRHFEERKRPIILRILQNELGPVLTDAKFLHLFPYADPACGGSSRDQMAYWDGIHTAAALYMDMLGSGDDYCGGGYVTVPSFAESTQLCRTFHMMNFLASTYIAAQVRSFDGEGPAIAPPSRSERLRVLRAFYRRQIVCNAWAPTRREPRWSSQDTAAIGNTNDHQNVRLGLFAAFEPWELQQVDHADHFIARLCTALCLAGEEVAQPICEAEFGDIFSHVHRLVQYMRERPSIADAALRTLPSLTRLSGRQLLDAGPAYRQFVERYSLICLQFAWQSHRSDHFPDPARDQRQQQQEEAGGGATVDFVGDAVDLPPFGWVDALDGHYMNWFGNALVNSMFRNLVPGEEETYRTRHFSLELWRGAGFALWDQKRVEAIKELDQLRTLRTGWLIY